VRLVLEIEGEGPQPQLPGGGAALIGLMSFAVSRGFGATHPMIALADRLHDVHHVRMGPLTTFYEADLEDAEDRAKFELAWQDPAGLADALEAVANAIASDEQCQTLVRRAGAEALPAQCRALLPALRRAEGAGARVRLGYHL
jgi:hypothetical protein